MIASPLIAFIPQNWGPLGARGVQVAMELTFPIYWSKQSKNFIYTKTEPAMKDSFTQAQIIGMIKEQESGMTIPAICRKHGIGVSTFYRWKGQYGGMTLSEAQRLKHLEKENQKLKTLVAERSLDKVMLQDVLAKKG